MNIYLTAQTRVVGVLHCSQTVKFPVTSKASDGLHTHSYIIGCQLYTVIHLSFTC